MKPYLSILTVIASLLGLLVLGSPQAHAQGATSTPAASALAVDPQKLLPGPDLTEEEESSRGELEAVLRAAREPLDQAAAHAALANWLLAVPPARPATRWIIGAAGPEDLRAIAESAQAATKHLDQAASLLKKPGDAAAGSADKNRRKKLAASLSSLRAFAGVMAAATLDANDTGRRGTWSEAAAALSESRESENPALASAATLWQAIAWDQSGRRERALTTLPGALAKPEQPADFMARILRCRILGDANQPTAATTLAAQIRARVDGWYADETANQKRARQRLVALVELEIGRRWAGTLRTGTQPADAELLESDLRKVKQKLIPTEDTAVPVYVMEEAIPTLVKPPTVKPAASAPDESPAGEPTSVPANSEK